jgi:hypothetical protein
MALNNLVYFSSLLQVNSRRTLLLKQARELKRMTDEKEDSAFLGPYLLTFCRAIWAFSSDHGELKEALGVAQDLSEDTRLTSFQRREAQHLKTSLRKKLAGLRRSQP